MPNEHQINRKIAMEVCQFCVVENFHPGHQRTLDPLTPNTDTLLVSGNYIIYLCNQIVITVIEIKNNYYICFFIHLVLFDFFSSSLYRNRCSRMIKVSDLEYFIAFTLKFGVNSLLSEGGDTGRGIREPLLTCSSFLCPQLEEVEEAYWFGPIGLSVSYAFWWL